MKLYFLLSLWQVGRGVQEKMKTKKRKDDKDTLCSWLMQISHDFSSQTSRKMWHKVFGTCYHWLRSAPLGSWNTSFRPVDLFSGFSRCIPYMASYGMYGPCPWVFRIQCPPHVEMQETISLWILVATSWLQKSPRRWVDLITLRCKWWVRLSKDLHNKHNDPIFDS